MPFSGDMLVSWRVYIILSRAYNFFLTFLNLHCYMPIWGAGAETDLDLLKSPGSRLGIPGNLDPKGCLKHCKGP